MAIDPKCKEWLANNFKGRVKFDEPMSRHTFLRVGGPADVFVEPENLTDLVELISWARQNELPYLTVGRGTNLLVKDSGIKGIVIALTKGLKNIRQTNTQADYIMVSAMAGSSLQTLCRFAIEHGFAGMNFALGIPGSIGGAIMMNAGTTHGAIADVLQSVQILLPSGQIKKIERKKLKFSYRKLLFPREQSSDNEQTPIILEGFFALRLSKTDKLKKEAQEILKARHTRQPTDCPSAGCFFKNPPTGKTAGELIELAGLKGKTSGGAKISSKHANFIINTGNASASDILNLMNIAQEKVAKIFNLYLEPEVKILG